MQREWGLPVNSRGHVDHDSLRMLGLDGDRFAVHFQALNISLNCLSGIGQGFFNRVALRVAARQGWDMHAVAAFFGLRFENHGVLDSNLLSSSAVNSASSKV